MCEYYIELNIYFYSMSFTEEMIPFVNTPYFIGRHEEATIRLILEKQPEVTHILCLESTLDKEQFKEETRVNILPTEETVIGIIESIDTRITFWLDREESLFHELEQIKTHPLHNHTLLIHIQSAITNHTLEKILEAVLGINPTYTLNYEHSNLLIASITDRPVCIHKYLTTCTSGKQPPGFADFLRGTIALYTLCQKHGYRLEVDRSHPVFSFLKERPYSKGGDTIELLECIHYDEKYKRLCELFLKGDPFEIFTNSFYTEKDGITKNWGPITEDCRAFLLYHLTPSSSTEFRLKHLFVQEYGFPMNTPYKVIHIRTGDYNLHNNHLDHSWLERYLPTIKQCVQPDVPYILISDCSIIANKLVESIPGLFYWNNQKTHIGDLINHEGTALLDTVCDFFILSKATEIFYTHDHVSGFSIINSILHDIPYIKLMPVRKPPNRFKRIYYSYS